MTEDDDQKAWRQASEIARNIWSALSPEAKACIHQHFPMYDGTQYVAEPLEATRERTFFWLVRTAAAYTLLSPGDV